MSSPTQRRPILRHAVAALAVVGFWTTCNVLAAQDRLIDGEPFDRIILDDANENRELDVAPLELHLRQVPDPLPRSGTLRVRLIDRPLEEFDVRWMNIVGIRLFETLVLDEAKQFAQDGRFKEAHENLTYLSRLSPVVGRLDQVTEDILEAEATWAFQRADFERAWMVLTALYERNPDRPGIARAVGSIADRLLEAHVSAGQFDVARRFLQGLGDRFGPTGRSEAARWRERLHEMAGGRLSAARAAFAAGNLDEARRAVEGALQILPDLDNARALAREIAAARPRIVVAVLAEAPQRLTRRLDDWGARRIEPLVDPPLVELRGFGADGGEYRSAYGELLQDAGGTATSLVFAASASGDRPGPHDVARQLLLAANGSTSVGTASRGRNGGFAGRQEFLTGQLAEVAVEGMQTLKLTWQHPHVRPEALLCVGISAAGAAIGDARERNTNGLFGVKDREQGELILVRKGETAGLSPTAPVEIVERLFDSDDDAVAALLRGDVDMVERVAATHATRLAKRSDVVVEQYALPTAHVLVTSASAPLLQVPELRRAVLYGVDRQGVVEQLLVSDGPSRSASVVSGPFLTGRDFADPMGYAYNRAIAARPYDPRLAATLAGVAARVGRPERKDAEDAQLPVLTLAHPSQPIPRAACQLMSEQLAAVGITLKLVEYAPEELSSSHREFDLRYAELAMWEPVVDARRLLGPRGELGRCSARMALALADVDRARNWQDVRQRLGDVHRIAQDELAVIPLWQTTNYFAYRKRVEGVPKLPVTLYQGVDAWDLSGEWEAMP